MSTDATTTLPEVDQKAIKMLKEALRLVNGTLDFDALAQRMDVPNAEAMRKRLRRFYEKDDEPLTIKGNQMGNENEAAAPKTPRTPRKAPASPVKKSATKKRKADENGDEKAATADATGDKDEDQEQLTVPKTPNKRVRSPRVTKAAKTAAEAKEKEAQATKEVDDDTEITENASKPAGTVADGAGDAAGVVETEKE